MNELDRRTVEEANRLYWDSDVSVADIAEQMGWSRRALYDAIEPLPTDAACEVCGAPLVFLNRSARSSATMSCVTCAAREEDANGGADAITTEDAEMKRAYMAEARDRRERIFAAGTAGLIGAGVAAALTFLLVRRH